jgi:hypothetical protein
MDDTGDWGEDVCAIRGHTAPKEISPGHWECKDCGGEWFDEDDD